MATGSLDIENPAALRQYLTAAGLLAAGEEVAITVLPGGVSGRTVLVMWPDGHGRVFKQALPKLRVAVDWFSDPTRIHREALGLRWLAQLAPPGSAPALIFEDTQEHVVGMEAVRMPHDNWKTLLLAGQLDDDHVRQFGQWLGMVHRKSWLQRNELAPAFDDRSFFESLRIEPYYQYTATRVPAAAAFLGELIATTRSRRLALVHGDYSPKNVLVHAGRLVVLDYEVIHWGDPAFDLGFGLTHLLSKAHHVRNRRVDFGRAASTFFTVYLKVLGDVPWASDVEPHAVRHALGCLLARGQGRSPLEYLDPAARDRQRDAVLAVIARVPTRVDDLVSDFLAKLETPCP
ncbi:MAG: phosphotransferase [Planctomycetes bacterium]|nr:phosphotransferase [Planctomycetota bacterium]